MPDWITALTSGPVLLVIAVLLFIAWGIVKLYRPVTAAVRFLDQLIGAPGRPGILDRMTAMEGALREQGESVRHIRHEVTPNGGGSMKDAVRRIEHKVDRDVDRLTKHLQVADRDQRRIDEVAETVEDIRRVVDGD